MFPHWSCLALALRLGDWAVIRVRSKVPSNPAEPQEEEVIQPGLCDDALRP
jgi:hypothetical protein